VVAAQAEAARVERESRNYLSALEAVENAVGLGGETRLYLARRGVGGEWEHLATMPGDAFDLDKVKVEYGGGHYRMQVRGVGPSGKKEWLDSAVFDIAGAPKSVDGPAPAVVAATPAGHLDGATTLLLESANERARDMRELVTSLIGALGGGAQRSDPLQVVSLAKEIAAIGQPPKGIEPEQYIKDRGDSFDKGMEKGLEIGQREGRRGGDDSWLGFAKDVVPEAIRAINKAAPALTAETRPPVRPMVAAPVYSPPLPPPPVPVQEVHTVEANKPRWFVGLERWLPMVGFAAQNGMAPEKSAALVIQQISDDDYDEFCDDVLGPDFVARVTPLLPPRLVAAFPEWVSRTLDAIKAAVQEEQAGADAEAGDEPAGPEAPEPAP
jgi:hypothetical protein